MTSELTHSFGSSIFLPEFYQAFLSADGITQKVLSYRDVLHAVLYCQF